MLDTVEVQRQLTHRLAELRKAATQRRDDVSRAREAFETVLDGELAPTVRQFVQVLKAQGFPFAVQTPAGAVRMTTERSADDFIEVALDVTRRPPAVVALRQYTRGRRLIDDERVVAEGEAIARLDAERILPILLDLIEPFVER
jgi:hypothetical protein